MIGVAPLLWALPPVPAIVQPATNAELRAIADAKAQASRRAIRRSTFPFPFYPPMASVVVGNYSGTDLVDVCRQLEAAISSCPPTAGGTLTVNSVSLHSFDVVVKNGNQTVSSFVSADWFTSTADSRSAFVIVRGNLTIDSGQIFIPSARKLFVCIYVTGNLTVNGTIAMTGRGANHSATGSNLAAGNIRIATGTFSAVVNPQVSSAGAAGGSSPGNSSAGNVGGTGTAGQTGGGGTGGNARSAANGNQAGAAGTSFSGGPGSGAMIDSAGSTTGVAASADGAKGGNGGPASSVAAGAGAGNPGGTGVNSGANGTDGTGGTLICLCEGTYSGSGTVEASGTAGGAASGTFSAAGGGSGGGHATVLCDTDSSGPTPSASGGAAGVATGTSSRSGGAGGPGTARKLTGL